ncbi:MAG: hypothetical protein AB7I42_26440 [Bradyrhizobium sp.]|uniref:hypothetical protein n=1 Tax=Bradyrhizobium sp. TaxID=376 RepID=UPI003D10E996
MTPAQFLLAARVPASLASQEFGPWKIERRKAVVGNLPDEIAFDMMVAGWDDYTILFRVSARTLHLANQSEVVMEDSITELRKHLPIWMVGRGRILVTGLGLGCVVRGLLASDRIEHVDVIEIDPDVLRIVGAELNGNPRVTLHHADALTWEIPAGGKWDFAWHDIWTDGDTNLQILHAELIKRFLPHTKNQGAWAFPRHVHRRLPFRAIGAPRRGASLQHRTNEAAW